MFVPLGELVDSVGGARWEGMRLEGSRKFIVERELFLREGAMGCLKEGEKEKGKEGLDGEEENWTIGRSENGKRKGVLRELRCRGLRFRCSCTACLHILV